MSVGTRSVIGRLRELQEESRTLIRDWVATTAIELSDTLFDSFDDAYAARDANEECWAIDLFELIDNANLPINRGDILHQIDQLGDCVEENLKYLAEGISARFSMMYHECHGRQAEAFYGSVVSRHPCRSTCSNSSCYSVRIVNLAHVRRYGD
jgi:hypothetical protein